MPDNVASTRRFGRVGQGDLLAGVVAATGLLVLVFLVNVNVVVAIALAVAIYVGIVLLRPRTAREVANIAGSATAQGSDERVAGTSPAPVGVTPAARRFGLTAREVEILPLAAKRLTNREIGEQLCISPKTVENHVASILGKLELSSRRELADFITKHDLLPPSLPPNADR